ncbi:MAG: zinc ribbon domain-containing protein [Patescibacteria group bacterium]|nr:zinc ribbon domain-containing protein [Patescibacteria group bacterium]
MPLYRYGCCNKEWENHRSINNRTNERCPLCGGKAVIIITGTQRPQCHEYYSMALNARITGPKQKKQLMKKLNVEEA